MLITVIIATTKQIESTDEKTQEAHRQRQKMQDDQNRKNNENCRELCTRVS
jgi:hypothetical protein